MSNGREGRYEPELLERRRQAAWAERGAFATPPISEEQPHIYVKPSAPFTSGNIHMGHVRSYSIGDAYARFRRARGDAVLFAFGFDAFGLPAELGAIAGGVPPSEWVSSCAEHMRGQLERLGFSFDWERSFMSSDPGMYRWSQWLFLVLLEAGLVYRGTGTVDWCDTCQTTLASIQVEPGGTCWRCHQPVRLIALPQWYLGISAYLEENDRRLAELEASGIWDKVALDSQREVLGRVEGAELELEGEQGATLTVFTPHVEALEQARFVLISARHPAVEQWVTSEEVAEQLEQLRSGGWERSTRDAAAIPLVDTRHTLRAPDGTQLPLLISPLVDGRFGPTVVLGVPALDRTDEVIARRIGLEQAPDAQQDGAQPGTAAEQWPGTRPAVRYRASDFTISRQRSWGTPIPIVYCEDCGAMPVPGEQLPVLLPRDIVPTGEGNPLAELDEFVNTSCPRCGGPGRRETDTLDCHFDALWLWIPSCVPQAATRSDPVEELLALGDVRHWLPSERLVAGSDSGNFVFDQRIVTKALRDVGPLAFLNDGEPFAGCLFHEMVLRENRKMSKHLGNVVDPDELVSRYGADTVRLAALWAASPQKQLNWDDSAVLRCHRFLTGVWDFSQASLAHARALAEHEGDGERTGQDASSGSGSGSGDGPGPAEGEASEQERDKTEHLRVKLAQWCENGMRRITADLEGLEMHSAARNAMTLFDRIKDFEKRVRERQPQLSAANSEALLEALEVLAQSLGPLAPHISEELWLALGHDEPGAQTPWPVVSFGVPA